MIGRRSGFLAAVAATLLAVGCQYERIDILVGSDVYNGETLSLPGDVEARKSGLLLKPGARFAIKVPYATQFLAQLEVAILSGDGMNVYLRTVSDKFDTTRGIAFRYAVDGCTIRDENGRTIPLEFNAETDQQMVTFTNEAALLAISVGCEQIFETSTTLPGTEYLIFETLPGSSVELRTINYFNTNLE